MISQQNNNVKNIMFKLQKGMPGLQKGMAHNGFRLQKGMSGCISARGCMHFLHHSCMHFLMPWMCIIDAQRPPLCRQDFSKVYNSIGFCNIGVAFLQVWLAQWACFLMEQHIKNARHCDASVAKWQDI